MNKMHKKHIAAVIKVSTDNALTRAFGEQIKGTFQYFPGLTKTV